MELAPTTVWFLQPPDFAFTQAMIPVWHMHCVSTNRIFENDTLHMLLLQTIGSFRMLGSNVGAYKLNVSIPAERDDVKGRGAQHEPWGV